MIEIVYEDLLAREELGRFVCYLRASVENTDSFDGQEDSQRHIQTCEAQFKANAKE